VNFEPTDDFEREVRQALERRPAPPGLKRKVMDQRSRARTQRVRTQTMIWQRLAASIVLAGAVAGGVAWRNHEDRRKGEAAREQVMTALRIANHALNQMKVQLAAHDRDGQE
jgi:hypothetical protein